MTPTAQDWANAERLWRQGEPPEQIAAALRCAEADVLARAAAEAWDRLPRRAAAIIGDPRCPTCLRENDLLREAVGGSFTGRLAYRHSSAPCVAAAAPAFVTWLAPAPAPAAGSGRTCESPDCDGPMHGRAANARFCHRCAAVRDRASRAGVARTAAPLTPNDTPTGDT